MAEDGPQHERQAGLLGVRELLGRLDGSRLCFGEPVQAGERMVIPVARVSGGGGWGSGRSTGEAMGGEGTGGGGGFEAAPVGFIDVGPEGSAFHAIPDPTGTARAIRTVLGSTGALATVAAGVRGLRQRRRAGLPSPRR